MYNVKLNEHLPNCSSAFVSAGIYVMSWKILQSSSLLLLIFLNVFLHNTSDYVVGANC